MDRSWPRGAALFVLLTVLVNWKEDRPPARLAYTLLALAVTVLALYWKRLYVVVTKFPRDVRFLYLVYNLQKFSLRAERENLTLVRCFTENVLRHPEKICLYFEGKSYTYRDVDEYSNRVARMLQHEGFRRGDVLALLMCNSIEYIFTWLGAAKLGVVSALVNYNLRDSPLVHSVNISHAKAVLFDSACADAVFAVRDRLTAVHTLYQFDGELREGAEDFQELLRRETDEDPVVSEQPSIHDPVLYVFTSGTTGLPKAAILPHSKFISGPTAFFKLFSLSPDKDIVYSPLPLYHAASGAFGVGIALMHGVPFVLVRKFSASRFWSDCIRYNATAAQYIGETCRYLLALPPTPAEKQHKVTKFLGNGLQPALWPTLRQRYNIAHIFELYASTEGNIGTANIDNSPGTIGFLPRLLPLSAYPLAIVRVDPTGEPIRDPVTDRCVRCEDNETGMIIGQIRDGEPLREFHGYVDRESTQKKILKDVFTKGDRYFCSGDLVSMDEFGYIYFKDRTGDTYRWKGENVSTAEVETVMTSALGDGVKGIAVYGVQVPGNEGKAGMAVIVDPSTEVDLGLLAQHLQAALPAYARPLFIRVAKEVPLTGTFKITKAKLQKEGFDIHKIKDPIYFFDSGKRTYIPLTEQVLDDIDSGRVRL